MKRTFIRKGFFACIVTLLAAASSIAQTSITTGAVTPASICAGSDVSVAFTSNVAYNAGNTFKVELSDATGTFSGNVLTATGAASPLTVKIPFNTVAGAGYKLRVISSDPATTGSESGAITVKGTPEAPYNGQYPGFCVGDNNASLPTPNIPGATYTWYAPDRTTPLTTTPTIITSYPLMNQTFIYSQTVNGCESGKSVITINVQAVTSPPTVVASPVICQNTVAVSDVLKNAITAGNSATLTWYESESGAGFSSIPTISTSTPGTKEYFVAASESMKCQSPKAKITVNITPAPVAPTVTNKSYSVGQTGIPALAANGTGSLIWFTEATGGIGVSTAPTPSTATAGTTSYWVTQTVDGCESPRAKIDVVVNAVQCTPSPAPTIVQPAAICQNNTLINTRTILSQAITSTGSNYKWYTSENATSFTATAPSTSVLTPGSFDYYVTQTNSGQCESPKAKITIVISQAPPAPGVTNKNYTVGQTNIPALSATGSGTFFWFTQEVSGNSLPAAPVPSTATAGTTSYWVTQTVNGCESPRARLDVIVTAAACTTPPAPTVTNKTYTVGDPATALTASGVTGAAFKWYADATIATPLTSAPVPTTTVPGIQTYYVSQTVNGCESPRVAITVTVSACIKPPYPTVSDLTYVQGTSAPPLTAIGLPNATLSWFDSNGLTMGATAPTPSTETIGTRNYYVGQTINGCFSGTTAIKVTIVACAISAASTVTSPTSYCASTTPVAALAATGTAIKWYNAAQVALATPPVPNVNVSSTTSTTYYVTQTEAGKCESAKKEVIITVRVVSALPTTVDLTVCQNSAPVTLTATGTTGAILKWYSTPSIETPISAAPIVNTNTVGAQTYYVSQTSANSCESNRKELKVDVKEAPAKLTVSPVNYCIDETPLELTPSGSAYRWYTSMSPEDAGTTVVPKVDTKTAKTSTYYVSQVNSYAITGGTLICPSLRAELKVVVNPRPAALESFSNALCQEKEDKTFTFTATPGATAGNTIVWYSDANETTPALPNVPTVSLKNTGETTVYAVQKTTATGCESPARASYKLRVKPLPAPPTVSEPLIEKCQFLPPPILSATPLASATLNWYGSNATGGTASAVAPIPSTAEGGTKSYYVSQTLEGCQGDRAKIDVKINTTPKPVTKTYLEYCQGVTAPILDATGTVLKWYRQFTDTEFQGYPYTPFTEKVEDYSFWVTQTGTNNCESPKEEIKIHIKAKPSATISGNTQIDLGQTANITLNFTADGPWTYILSDGKTGTSNQATISIPVTPAATTNYFVTEVKNSCGIGTPMGTAQVTVRIPTIITGSPSVAEACAGKTFTVPFQQSGDFPTGNTFKIQIAQENLDAKFYSIPSVATGNSITATFPDTTKGGFYFVRVINSGTNASFDTKGSVNTIGITVSPLPIATISGTQTVFVGSPATLKVEITGKAPWSFTLSNGTKDSVITAAASPYSFVMSPRTTTTYTIASATNTCGVGRGAGSARVQVDPILGLEPTGTAWLKVYPTVANPECIVEMTAETWSKDANIKILDLNGRSIHTQPIRTKTTTLEFSKYPSGLYLLQVEDGNRRSVNRVMKP